MRNVQGRKFKILENSILLSLLVLICTSYFFPRWADWGVNSKMDLTMAIVDEGTFSIDNYYQNTGDYALYKGHYFSDKAPGASFLGIPAYAGFKYLFPQRFLDGLVERLANNQAISTTLNEEGTGILRDKVYFAIALYVVTFFVMVLSSAFLIFILFIFLRKFSSNQLIVALVVLLYGLGTIAFPYAQTFNGRQIAAVLLILIFYLLFKIKAGEISDHFLWLVGLLMGYVVITDYPSVLIVGGLFIYAANFLRDIGKISRLILGALPPMLLMAFYNYSIFDNPLPVGYKYSELYQDLHSEGIISITYPKWDALYGLTFSRFRGLFFFSPALLLAIPGFIIWFRRNKFRQEFWVCLWAVSITLLFYASSVMWWGGFAVGPAYLAAAIPFLLFPIVISIEEFDAIGVIILIILVILSIALIWTVTIAGQSFPDLSPDPLSTLSIPALRSGDVARNLGMILKLQGLQSLIPLVIVAGLILIIAFMRAGKNSTIGS